MSKKETLPGDIFNAIYLQLLNNNEDPKLKEHLKNQIDCMTKVEQLKAYCEWHKIDSNHVNNIILLLK